MIDLGWKELLLVAAGGGLGSVLRLLLSLWMRSWWGIFPIGTLVINILACFVAGLVAGYMVMRGGSDWWRYFVLAGFCGGFSTFSTFSLELVQLIQLQQHFQVWAYLLLSVGLGFVAAYEGWRIFTP